MIRVVWLTNLFFYKVLERKTKENLVAFRDQDEQKQQQSVQLPYEI